MTGKDAIEDLLGYNLAMSSKEDIFMAMNDVLDQMPDNEQVKFYKKYCC